MLRTKKDRSCGAAPGLLVLNNATDVWSFRVLLLEGGD
jgi:hypothetical protein